MANVTALVFIKMVKRHSQIGITYEYVEVDCAHQKLVKRDLAISVNVTILQAVEQGFTILNIVQTFFEFYPSEAATSILIDFVEEALQQATLIGSNLFCDVSEGAFFI